MIWVVPAAFLALLVARYVPALLSASVPVDDDVAGRESGF
jgi:hypothetical protein